MTVNQERRGSGWKIAAGVVAVLASTVLGFVFWIDSVGSRRMAEMARALTDLRGEYERRPDGRISRGGQPGNAWDDYLAASGSQSRDGKDWSVIEDLVGQHQPVHQHELVKALKGNAAALDLLRRGVRRERAVLVHDWTDGFNYRSTVSGLEILSVAKVGIAQARVLREEGKAHEALDLLLDVGQACRDAGFNSILLAQSAAIGLLSKVSWDLRELLIGGKLSSADLSEMDRVLQALDAGFPRTGDALMNDCLPFGYACLRVDGVGVFGSAKKQTRFWRYAWSEKILAAKAFERMVGARRRAADIDAMSWTDVEKRSDEIEASRNASDPADALFDWPRVSAQDGVSRTVRARLRMLRVAARFKAATGLPELEDPFGGKLNHREQDGRLKVWTVGQDGVDNGGLGDWGQYGQDIVLEVNR